MEALIHQTKPASTMTKTLEECMNELARSYQFPDWPQMEDYLNEELMFDTVKDRIKEAALLYGEAKFNEGAEEQMKEVYKKIGPDGNTNIHAIKHWTPKPTFKP